MTAKVLFVDDEPSVLDGVRRQLRKRIKIDTAVSGQEGLERIQKDGPFDVVVSDMRMPGMNGAEFLGHVRTASPDTVRIILSGQAELESTIAAVNSGQLFRFLTKPCSAEELWDTVKAGIEQYRLIHVERELLDNTLSGAVDMLTDILSITNPTAFVRASRIRHYAEDIGAAVGLGDDWQFRLAAMLSQIGCITLPADTLAKIYAGQELSDEEAQLFQHHPEIGGKLVDRIPRLDGVARMILGQTGVAQAENSKDDAQDTQKDGLAAQVLHAAAEFDRLLVGGQTPAQASSALAESLPASVAEALKKVQVVREESRVKVVKVGGLVVGMILDEDLMSANGMRLMPAGQRVTQSTIIRLRSIANGVGVAQPFRVRVGG